MSDLVSIPSLLQGTYTELETACFLSGLSVQLFKQIVFDQLIIDEESSCLKLHNAIGMTNNQEALLKVGLCSWYLGTSLVLRVH